MAESVQRVLTYNVKMLPGVFGCGDADLARAERIADAVLERDYDVVALQEVFDEDARCRFVARLGQRFPHRVERTGDDWFNEDSGLMLFSRSRFCAAPAFVEWRSVGPLWNHDRWADKGVQLARLDLGGGLEMVVANLHMQSDRHGPATYRPVRADQLAQLARVLDRRLLRARQPSQLAAVVAGDFNVVGESTEHGEMLETLRGARDLFRDTHASEPGYTIDGANNTMVDDEEISKRLDYLLAMDAVPGGGPDGARLDLATTAVESIEVKAFEHEGESLSDHFALEATLRLASA